MSAGKDGGASRDGGFGLRSGSETSDTFSPAVVLARSLDAEGVIGTEVDRESGSGAGGVPTC